ncbi:hypothetical protein B9Z55_010813 [Caenorhabditis nigoni]|uniref:Uncharacterized protein n=2 Tax=Caenorhabditis nigoni TaxID=1611254 RepID=A0A2G5UI14_9PELO|nr:hypothetical protein B9Z55_010813 [Caenorhabditis nigoni]
MSRNAGHSRNSEDQPSFQKRKITELVKLLPECEGHRWVENLNETFELLDEKMGMMTRVMTSLMCNEEPNTIFSRTDVLKRVLEDCRGITSLMQIQKMKLAAIRHEIPQAMDSNEIRRENTIMRRLFSGKRKLPMSPFLFKVPETKKRKVLDIKISNVYRSVYREFLVYPSPIFKLSEFISHMNELPKPNRYTEEQVHLLVPDLMRRTFINGFSCNDGTDYLVVKELCMQNLGKQLSNFVVTEDEYMTASVPKSLSDLKEMIAKLDIPILEKLDSELWSIVSNMILATAVRQAGAYIFPNEFPSNLQNSVLKVVTTLINSGFIEECQEDGQPQIFAKRIRKDTVERLRATVEIDWCLNNSYK